MMHKLTKTNQERVFETQRMKGVKVTYSDETGEPVLTHTIIVSNPSVAIIIRKDNKIAFIQQFRSTTGETYIELPAGVIDNGESEIEAAIRESEEETGILVKNVHSLVKGPSLLDPSKSNENYGVVIADFDGCKERNLDEAEQIDSNILYLEETEVFTRLKNQLYEGTPFYDNLFMSGHSLYALMAYMLTK